VTTSPAVDDPEELRATARGLIHEGKAAEAEGVLRACLAIDANDVRALALHLLGTALDLQSRRSEAIDAYGAALAVEPSHAPAGCNLAALHRHMGDHAAAARLYRRVLDVEPSHTEALYGLSVSAPPVDGDASDTFLDERLAASEPGSPEEVSLLFSRANRFHWHRRFDQAFALYEKANAATRAREPAYDFEHLIRAMDQTMERLSAGLFTQTVGWGNDSARPLFIVGAPRSGKTLLERLLAFHPDVAPAGELKTLEEVMKAVEIALSGTGSVLQRDFVDRLATAHLGELARLVPPAARYVVDTNAMNSLLLGFGALMFPKARIIICRREPRDSGLECFTNRFMTQHYASDLGDIGRFLDLTATALDHWKAVLPNPMIEVRFEDVLRTPDRTMEKLMDFLDLGPVSPQASDLEPSSPVSFRADDYAAFLGPLEAGLGPS